MPGGIEPHSRPPRLKTPVTSSPAHKKRVELEYDSAEPQRRAGIRPKLTLFKNNSVSTVSESAKLGRQGHPLAERPQQCALR